MGKKSSQSSVKVHKHGKKQQINSPIKISRPKYEVYITNSSNFKNLVQELTGNGNSSTPCIPISPPVPYTEVLDYGYQENMSLDSLSFDSSCFSIPLDGSPDLRVQDSSNSEMGNSQNMDFAAQYRELEALLMEMDSGLSYNYDSNCGIVNQQEVCVYDYDLPCFV